MVKHLLSVEKGIALAKDILELKESFPKDTLIIKIVRYFT